MDVEPRFLRRGMQSVFGLLFDRQCLACETPVETEDALCPDCWRETRFIAGLVCDLCGLPLPGESSGQPEYCDDCLTIARPWQRGRAAVLYAGTGRNLVLAMKHADRPDLAVPLGGWMARAVVPLMTADTVFVPVPLHRWWLFRRRYNQSAELARAVAGICGRPVHVDALRRPKATGTQDGRDREGRFANLAGTISVARPAAVQDRDVILVDDVMTSGATFAAAAEACHAAGATSVSVLALARVAKDA